MDILKKIYRKMVIKVVSIFNLGSFLQSKNSISVLTYHGIRANGSSVNDFCFISQEMFDKQMKYLSENFDVKSAEEAFLGKYDNSKPVAVITFDDGFLNNYIYGLPILKKYNLPATIFLSTGFINKNDTIWFCKVIDIVENSKNERIEWNGKLLRIKTQNEKRVASSIIQSDLKILHPQRINIEIDSLMIKSGRTNNFSKTPFEMLNKNSIDEMISSGIITFGAHTHGHRILTRLSKSESEIEIKQSLREVKKLTGKPCNIFAYPNGGAEDYSDFHKTILADCNVDIMFSMKHGLSSKQDDHQQIKRLFISSHFNMKQFTAYVHGY